MTTLAAVSSAELRLQVVVEQIRELAGLLDFVAQGGGSDKDEGDPLATTMYLVADKLNTLARESEVKP